MDILTCPTCSDQFYEEGESFHCATCGTSRGFYEKRCDVPAWAEQRNDLLQASTRLAVSLSHESVRLGPEDNEALQELIRVINKIGGAG